MTWTCITSILIVAASRVTSYSTRPILSNFGFRHVDGTWRTERVVARQLKGRRFLRLSSGKEWSPGQLSSMAAGDESGDVLVSSSQRSSLLGRLDVLRSEIKRLDGGMNINCNSKKDVGMAIFGYDGYHKNDVSTTSAVLKKIVDGDFPGLEKSRRELAALVLEYRGLQKQLDTMDKSNGSEMSLARSRLMAIHAEIKSLNNGVDVNCNIQRQVAKAIFGYVSIKHWPSIKAVMKQVVAGDFRGMDPNRRVLAALVLESREIQQRMAALGRNCHGDSPESALRSRWTVVHSKIRRVADWRSSSVFDCNNQYHVNKAVYKTYYPRYRTNTVALKEIIAGSEPDLDPCCLEVAALILECRDLEQQLALFDEDVDATSLSIRSRLNIIMWEISRRNRGLDINCNSPQRVGFALFRKYGESTDKATLNEIVAGEYPELDESRRELAALILEYRELQKQLASMTTVTQSSETYS